MALTPFQARTLAPWVGTTMDPFAEMSMMPFGNEWGVTTPMSSYLANYPRQRVDELMRQTRNEMSPFAPILSCDLYETETDYHLHVDLPGCDPADVDVSVVPDPTSPTAHTLLIKAERKHAFAEDTDILHRSERTFGRVQRKIPVPARADGDKAKATFKDGILEISIPKRAPAAPGRKLKIGTR